MTDTIVKDQVQQYLEHEIQRKLAEAAGIAETAAAGGRGMEPDEETKANGLLSEVADLKQRVSEMQKTADFKERLNAMTGPTVSTPEEAKDTSSLGGAFVKSEGYTTLKSKGFAGTGRWTTGGVDIPWNGKATVSETASPIVATDYQVGIDPTRFQRLTVADLIPQGTTNGTSISTIQETTATNAAAPVLEGGQKQESTVIFTPVLETVAEIATFLPVTNAMLEDVNGIRSYLDGRLGLFVKITEEQQILAGTGTAPELSGIMDRAIQSGSALSLDTDRSTDAIFKAMTAIHTVSQFTADAMVIHPTDWAALRLLKDNSGQYYGGGPFTGAYGNGGIAPDGLWGLKVVVTTAIAQGTCLVGAFATGAFIWRRSGLTVEASNSHADFFQYNKTAIRAEERLALGVLRPQAFYKITGIDQLMGS